MNGKFLLDTNIIIALFAGDMSIQKRLAQVEEVFAPSIVIGELYFGAYKSKRIAENLARIEEFAVSSSVLGCDAGTAREYGLIKNGLREKGYPIPENDIWIAAIAQQYDLALVTRDEHFNEVKGLEREIW